MDGKRTELASAGVVLPGAEWQSLEVRMQGDRFEGLINGTQQLEARQLDLGRAGVAGAF